MEQDLVSGINPSWVGADVTGSLKTIYDKYTAMTREQLNAAKLTSTEIETLGQTHTIPKKLWYRYQLGSDNIVGLVVSVGVIPSSLKNRSAYWDAIKNYGTQFEIVKWSTLVTQLWQDVLRLNRQTRTSYAAGADIGEVGYGQALEQYSSTDAAQALKNLDSAIVASVSWMNDFLVKANIQATADMYPNKEKGAIVSRGYITQENAQLQLALQYRNGLVYTNLVSKQSDGEFGGQRLILSGAITKAAIRHIKTNGESFGMQRLFAEKVLRLLLKYNQFASAINGVGSMMAKYPDIRSNTYINDYDNLKIRSTAARARQATSALQKKLASKGYAMEVMKPEEIDARRKAFAQEAASKILAGAQKMADRVVTNMTAKSYNTLILDAAQNAHGRSQLRGGYRAIPM